MNQASKKSKIAEEDNGGSSEEDYFDHEEQLLALIEHRTREVEHIKKKITYYKTQLEEAERRLNDSQSKLARLRFRDSGARFQKNLADSSRNVKEEPKVLTENNFHKQSQSRPKLIIPAVTPKIAQPVKLESNLKSVVCSGGQANLSLSTQSNGVGKIKRESYCKPSDELDVIEMQAKGTKKKLLSFPTPFDGTRKLHGEFSCPSDEVEIIEVQAKGTKRKSEQKEHMELISLIRSRSSPCTIGCQPGVHIFSQHKRKLRSLALCPSNDELFVTSSLDGFLNLWQLQCKGSSVSLLSSTDCMSKKRRWPEDIAWHPQGDRLFCVYTVDDGDCQLSILHLNTTDKEKRVAQLNEQPHFKGTINNIAFMPWPESCFATGGSDHAVVLWNEKDDENSWKYKALHRNLHTSAVMGVAGLQQKNIVLSAGADKKVFGFDVLAGRADFKHQLECKCMSVLPNPSDFNLFMVQTGAHERQLRLFDIRARQTEIHAFGWKQESSDTQSALISQAWSPDGLYISSGSADPIIHIFDIRYNSNKPSQSVKAHQKRVFKAVWLKHSPLLVSISSDLNIGLHKIT